VAEPRDPHVRAMTADDWPEVQAIYEAGIATGHATFESEPPSWEQFDAVHAAEHRLVAVDLEAGVVGWTAVVPVSDRCVYAGVAEHSVYVAPGLHGQRIGSLLLAALISSTERAGVWTLQSGIFPENTASLVLHERAGFSVVGTRRRVGRMTHGPLAGAWRDVVLVERRSTVAGT
jgi:L-amino acid N-acyltransferase YncA